jgi:hypothetical protein
LEVYSCARAYSRRVAGCCDVDELIAQLPSIRIEAAAGRMG